MLAPLHVEQANDIAPPCEAAVKFASLTTVASPKDSETYQIGVVSYANMLLL